MLFYLVSRWANDNQCVIVLKLTCLRRLQLDGLRPYIGFGPSLLIRLWIRTSRSRFPLRLVSLG